MNGIDSNTSGANTAKFRFKQRGATDKIPDSVIEELAARGYVTIEVSVTGSVLIQPTEPEDKTKIWWQSDINGVPQGVPKTYDTATGQWKSLDPGVDEYVPPGRRNGTVLAPEGASVQTFGPFTSLLTDKYQVTLTPSLFWDGVWHTPPVAFPSNFGYFLANRSSTLFTVQFYGIPEGGLAWEWQAEVIPADQTV